MIAANMPYEKQYCDVLGKRIAYVEVGEGEPIVLLHGNPTSSYLWRNVIPLLQGKGRVIAPDLIGQGDSEKLPASDGPERYTFDVAYQYLDGLLQALGAIENVTLVIHDWGSALGFYWAQQHPEAVSGIAYMEGIVCPLSWDDWPEGARGIFQGFRSAKGESLVLERNMFVEAVLPSSVMRGLGEEEMQHYRAAFGAPDDRQPTLNWPRQIPIDGTPAEMVALVTAYGEWLQGTTDLPKLFINAEPGSILTGRQREYCRSWPNQREVTVKGTHFYPGGFAGGDRAGSCQVDGCMPCGRCAVMRLHGASGSPFVRKVQVALALKGLPYEQIQQLPFTRDAEYRKINPLGKIPTLQDGDLTICDSTVICEYLEEAYPQAPLYPVNPADRARARWLEELGGSRVAELAAGIFFQRFMRPMVLKQEPDEALVAKIINRQLPPLLDYLESQVPAQGFIFGAFMMADMSLMSPFVNAAYAGYEVDAQRWPVFTHFIARVKVHPVVSEVLATEAVTMGFS